jgi:hypothetical protein
MLHYFFITLANSSVGKEMGTGCTIRAPSTTDTGISLPTTPAVVGPNQPLNELAPKFSSLRKAAWQ